MGLYGSVQIAGGALVAYYSVKSFIWLISRIYCYHPFAKPIDFGTFGKWTVVTGGTDGIGAEYVRQLAQAGQNIIIVGRNMEKLNKMKSEVENRSTEVVLVQADLSNQDGIHAACTQLKILSKEKEIGILVNSAGVCYKGPEIFHKLEDREVLFNNIVTVNCAALVQISAAVVEAMNNRNRGLIINIGSISGGFATPHLSVYAASKSFVNLLSRSLYYEYKPNGVLVQHISPAFVRTKMSRMRNWLMVPTSKKFVQSALCTVTRLQSTCGYFPHDLQSAVCALLPDFMCANMHIYVLHEIFIRNASTFMKEYKEE